MCPAKQPFKTPVARSRRVAANSLYGAFICTYGTVAPANRIIAPPESPALNVCQPVFVNNRIHWVSPGVRKGWRWGDGDASRVPGSHQAVRILRERGRDPGACGLMVMEPNYCHPCKLVPTRPRLTPGLSPRGLGTVGGRVQTP